MRIDVDQGQIADFCRRHGIRKLAFFGSVLSEDFGPDSDVDVLVEFEENRRVGLLRMAGMQLDLEKIIGRPVDMRTPQDLSVYFRDEVVAGAEVRYAA